MILLLPLALANNYWYEVAILVGINAIVCVGLNLLIGYAGQISLGHAGFFGLGAYGSAILDGALRLAARGRAGRDHRRRSHCSPSSSAARS